ncbi:MAG: hypothetical protein R3D69_10675 [Xanthobacteraceae bacterium]
MQTTSQLIDELRRRARERDIAAKVRPFELLPEQRAKLASLLTIIRPARSPARTSEITPQ